jgi:cell division protein FtsB
MKYLMILVGILTLLLQYRLLSGEGSIQQINQYKEQIDQLKIEVKQKKDRNEAIYADVVDLRKGKEALEERARYELGMIKEGETFFQIVE